MFGSLGTTEIIIIVLIVLILFGGKKIPELMRGLGSGVKEFKKATNDDDDRRIDDRRIDDRRYDDRRIDDRRDDRPYDRDGGRVEEERRGETR